MSDQMETLLVGLGARGKIWARLLHDEPAANVVGYVDLLESNLEWAREHYSASPTMCFTSMKEALSETKPQFVILSTPPMDRYREVMQVFESGAHLLSEKPLTMDLKETIDIVHASKSAELGFAVGMNFRYQHCVTEAQRVLREGEIGKPSFAQFTYWVNRDGNRPGINRFPLSMRQPMLYEQSVHHFDEMRFVYDAEVETILACRCHNPPWSMYQDDATVSAMFEFGDGLHVQYFGTWAGQTGVNSFLWRTDCDEGSLFQHEMFSDLRIARGHRSTEVEKFDHPPEERLVDDARLMLADVIRQLNEGQLEPHPSGVDYLKTMALVVACEQSHLRRQPITMADFYDEHEVPAEWR